jgi:hypothetical protein
MMMIPISVMNRRVAVGRVKYSYQIIRTPEHIALIKDLLSEEIDAVEHVLPTLTSKNSLYPYADADSLKASFRRATQDAINGKFMVRDYLRYLRRIFICAVIVKDDKGFSNKLLEIKQLANYIEANKNEI